MYKRQEGHVCLDDEKYIIHSDGRVKLTQYALSHMDECCLAFDKGYSYQSKYQGQKYYTQMMYKTPSQVAAQEYSFEMNAHNRTLLSQIQRASRSADAMRLYPCLLYTSWMVSNPKLSIKIRCRIPLLSVEFRVCICTI